MFEYGPEAYGRSRRSPERQPVITSAEELEDVDVDRISDRLVEDPDSITLGDMEVLQVRRPGFFVKDPNSDAVFLNAVAIQADYDERYFVGGNQ